MLFVGDRVMYERCGVTVKCDTRLTNCGFRVGFVSKYIPFLLSITFFHCPFNVCIFVKVILLMF